MELIASKTAADAGKRAVKRLDEILAARKGKPTLLLIAGGSWLPLLDRVSAKNLGSHLIIGMSDERWSEHDHDSNFGQLRTTKFYTSAAEHWCAFIDSRVTVGETLQALMDRMDREWRTWRAAHPDGKIIATLGVGADGHTCGIMPFPEAPDGFASFFDSTSRWVVGYDASGKNPYPFRATATLAFLRQNVDESVAYAVGAEKRAAIARVTADEGSLAATPARILRDVKSAVLFTDKRV